MQWSAFANVPHKVELLIGAQISAGLAVLWVTHDIEQARRVAVRRLFVTGGRVREEVDECPVILR